MSRARHKKSGGSVYSGAGSNVVKDAAETQQKKSGGAVKDMGKIMGAKSKKRMDRRARGGRIGSDKSPMAPGAAMHPFSSAAKTS